MARAITDGLISGGVSAKLMSLKSCHRSDIVTEILSAGALLVGSPTINNNMFPTVADLLIYLKGLKPQNLIGTAFGSYGWSGEAVKLITNHLRNLKLNVPFEGIAAKFFPSNGKANDFYEFGKKVGEALLAMHSEQQEE